MRGQVVRLLGAVTAATDHDDDLTCRKAHENKKSASPTGTTLVLTQSITTPPDDSESSTDDGLDRIIGTSRRASKLRLRDLLPLELGMGVRRRRNWLSPPGGARGLQYHRSAAKST